jgi:hypothetical protein
VTPVLVGLIAVLFQFGILFITYLGLVNMGRDLDRWLAVHPDTTDVAVLQHLTADLPNSVMFPTEVDGPYAGCTFNSGSWTCLANATLNPTLASGALVIQTVGYDSSGGQHSSCSSSGSTPCSYRTATTPLQVTLTYDASSRFFLPLNFRLGFLNVNLGNSIKTQSYTITMMVEQH